MLISDITTWKRLIFIDHKIFEDDISVISDRFSAIKCLSELWVVGKFLVDDKLLLVSKHLVDTNLFCIGKHLVDTKHLASLEVFTN